MPNNGSGTGQGGKSMQDRELAAEVRKLALSEIKEILLDKDNKTYSKDLHIQVLLKLTGSILPRLNEHTGADGKDLIPTAPYDYIKNNRNNNSNRENTKNEQEDTSNSRRDISVENL